jgi:hypothetical protein
MPSAAAAAKYVSALGTARARTCLESEDFSGSFSAWSSTLPGGQRYVEVRTVTSLPEAPQKQLHLDTFFFAAGPTMVGLVALGGDAPPPSAAEHRLLTLLHSRAEAHKL